jgi:hypothetical protein
LRLVASFSKSSDLRSDDFGFPAETTNPYTATDIESMILLLAQPLFGLYRKRLPITDPTSDFVSDVSVGHPVQQASIADAVPHYKSAKMLKAEKVYRGYHRRRCVAYENCRE